LPNLSEFIKIDNLSPDFDPEWETNGKLLKAAEFLKNWCMSQEIEGLNFEILNEKGRTPFLFGEI